MIYIAICDDSAECREELEGYCRDFFAGTQEIRCETFSSGEAFLKSAGGRQEPFDIALLDVEMEKINGIQVKKWLEESGDTQILFVTSHDEYMPQAFGYHVFGFLKKPIEYAEFAEKMRSLTDVLERKRRFVMVSTMRGRRKILLRDIDYIKGDGKYTYFYLKHTAGGEEKFLEDRSYGYWKETLRDCDFVEIKKGYLINFANVTEMEDGAVVFENGTSITCSARKRRMIRDYFEAYVEEHAR